MDFVGYNSGNFTNATELFPFIYVKAEAMTASNEHNCNPEKWVDNYGDHLFAWAFHRTGKKTVAEDLVQETFLSALHSLHKFRGESSEKTWLFSILKNKIIDHYRKSFVKYEIEESDLNAEANKETFLNRYFDRHGQWKKSERPANWHADDHHLLDDEEFREMLKMCLEFLPENWLAIITLRFLEEKQTPDICKDLNITPSNFWVIIHRAKLQLRDCIEENLLDQ